MSPEKQQIAIAKACGLKNIRRLHINDGAAALVSDCPTFPGQWAEVPDYPSDLNAMHEAEKMLTDKQFETFRYKELSWICHRDIVIRGVLATTAAQRAEAFLKTLNLWVD